MHASKRIKVFTDKYPLLGPIFWMVSIQYFIIQLVAAFAWSNPSYSFNNNAISDLGNTACGLFSERYVCSPFYSLMNISFMLLGITMIAGSFLIYQEFIKNAQNRIGFIFMALAGFGTFLVGAFPENTVKELHFIGALLPFLLGNIALLIFGFSLGLQGKFKFYTIASGVVALIALPLFFTKTYLGLSLGGMERLVAHPQTVWLIIFGLYMSRNHFKNAGARTNQRFQKNLLNNSC
jgi:hypothetical membrane protein